MSNNKRVNLLEGAINIIIASAVTTAIATTIVTVAATTLTVFAVSKGYNYYYHVPNTS